MEDSVYIIFAIICGLGIVLASFQESESRADSMLLFALVLAIFTVSGYSYNLAKHVSLEAQKNDKPTSRWECVE